jgi:hypothetical protein
MVSTIERQGSIKASLETTDKLKYLLARSIRRFLASEGKQSKATWAIEMLDPSLVFNLLKNLSKTLTFSNLQALILNKNVSQYQIMS